LALSAGNGPRTVWCRGSPSTETIFRVGRGFSFSLPRTKTKFDSGLRLFNELRWKTPVPYRDVKHHWFGAKTSKSPPPEAGRRKAESILFLFSPLLILSFLMPAGEIQVLFLVYLEGFTPLENIASEEMPQPISNITFPHSGFKIFFSCKRILLIYARLVIYQF